METSINCTYILTPEELTVIAAGKNIRGILSVQDEVQMDETIVLQTLNHLYQQDFIRNTDEDSFALNEDLEKMMEIISKAKEVVLIRTFDQKGCSKAIYIGSGLVAIERSKTDVNAVRIYEILPTELYDFINEDIRDKKKQYKEVLDEEQLFQRAIENPSILQGEEMDSLRNVMLMIEKINQKSGKVSCRLFDKQEKEERKQIYYSNKEQQESIFEEETFIKKAVSIVEEALL